MEGLALILIGAALFSHSWYLLGVYPEGRTMGVFTAALGLAALITLTMAPMVLTGEGKGADLLAETTIMKGLIILWAGYAVAVGAHGLWELDDRAIGFYSAFLAIASLIALLYFAVELRDTYGDGVWLGLSGAAVILSGLAGMLFFYLAIPFSGLRAVTAWFLLIGSVAVSAIGLAIMTTVIRVA